MRERKKGNQARSRSVLTFLALLGVVLLPQSDPRAASEDSNKSAVPRPIEVPLKTWVARPMADKGVACPGGSCKHMRLAHNPDNGRIYFLGGDYSGPTGMQSGRNELYSYSIAENNWRLEFPYCGPEGSVQPSHPDEVGWVYDTRRKIFWMIPGYMGGNQKVCPNSTLVRGKIMTFDPAARKWDLPDRKGMDTVKFGKGIHLFATYDEATDSIVVLGQTRAAHYDIKSDTWSAAGKYGLGKQLFVNKEYVALDPAGRVIYAIDPRSGQLYGYRIDARGMVSLGSAPSTSVIDTVMPIWDSVNKVLLWPQYFKDQEQKLHVYDPKTAAWNTVPIRQPEGITVHGRHAVFDPQQNVLLLMGDPSGLKQPYVFLYRHSRGPNPAM